MPLQPTRFEATLACHAVGLAWRLVQADIQRPAIALEARAGRPAGAGPGASELKPRVA